LAFLGIDLLLVKVEDLRCLVEEALVRDKIRLSYREKTEKSFPLFTRTWTSMIENTTNDQLEEGAHLTIAFPYLNSDLLLQTVFR